MPRRTDLKKILLIGSGPIIIGQACEFDYSGTQACKALREEGYTVVLVNSNPATIMTDPEMADRTYIEPITWEVVAKIIEKERPDALLPTLGGQTGLNTAMDLHQARRPRKVRRRDDRRQRRRPSTRPRTARSSRRPWSRSAWQCPRAAWPARWPRPRKSAIRSACPACSGPASPWAAPAAASPTTARNSTSSSPAASISAPSAKCSSRNRSSAGRNTSWK